MTKFYLKIILSKKTTLLSVPGASGIHLYPWEIVLNQINALETRVRGNKDPRKLHWSMGMVPVVKMQLVTQSWSNLPQNRVDLAQWGALNMQQVWTGAAGCWRNRSIIYSSLEEKKNTKMFWVFFQYELREAAGGTRKTKGATLPSGGVMKKSPILTGI